MKMSLEDDINMHEKACKGRFADDLLSPIIIPGFGDGYYLKHDSKEGISHRLQADNIDFGAQTPDDFERSLYSAINKEPLKQVGYGTLNARLPKEIGHLLSPWEAMYAYVGIWGRKSTTDRYKKIYTDPKELAIRLGMYGLPDTLKSKTLYQIIHMLITDGIERIKYVHNKLVDEGKFKNKMITAPHEEEIKDKFVFPTITTAAQKKNYNPAQINLFEAK